MKLRPRRLILHLMLTDIRRPLGVRDAITAGALFGIKESSVRVAMTRLSADGLIQASDRGEYRLGPAARSLAEDVARWRSSLKQLRSWRGTWIGVNCAALPRSDRSALRRRERGLAMTGFVDLGGGLFMRPDNLAGGVENMRKRLRDLGLEEPLQVFGIHDLDPASRTHLLSQWPVEKLNRAYRDTQAQLQAWLERCHLLDPTVAAREAFVIGDAAIRQMVFDPLLPEELVDAPARQAFFETLLAYDEAGKAIWLRLYAHASHQRELPADPARH